MRRSIVILSAICLSALIFSSLCPPSRGNNIIAESSGYEAFAAPAASDWSMFRYDLGRTGYTSDQGPGTSHVLWSDYVASSAYSSPAVAGGNVYVGSDDNSVYCLNAYTGAMVWSYATGGSVQSSPAVASGSVFVGSGDGFVYALDAVTGVKQWSYATGGGVYSSPAVDGGRLYVGSSDGYLYCLGASDGSPIWSFPVGDVSYSSPAISGGSVYIGAGSGQIYCLDEATGELKWSYSAGSYPGARGLDRASPSVSQGRVYISYGIQDESGYPEGAVLCLDASTGTQIWSFTSPNSMEAQDSLAVYGNRVLACFYDSSRSYVYCLDASTGGEIWEASEDQTLSSPAATDGRIYMSVSSASGGGGLLCLDSATGSTVWSYDASSPRASSPAIVGGKAYAALGQSVYCFGTYYLTINANGISPAYPVDVKSNGAVVGTVSDARPLVLAVASSSTIEVDTKSPAPHIDLRFIGWTGEATGTSSSNPITVVLSGDSSCITNFEARSLTSFAFRDSRGNQLHVNPSRIQVLAPNGSLITVTSYSDLHLDSGTWTVKEIRWQGSNVKPLADPTYDTAGGGTWSIDCRVYAVDFANSFRDSSGNALYSHPSFRLTLPNGTVTASLKTGTYYLQNGTVTWRSITWQGNDVVPSAPTSFDAANGSPTVNCRVYTVNFANSFRDNEGNVLYCAPSFRLTLPNGTISQLNTGTYHLQNGTTTWYSITWQGSNIAPQTQPSFDAADGDPTVNTRVYALKLGNRDQLGNRFTQKVVLTFPNLTSLTKTPSSTGWVNITQVQGGTVIVGGSVAVSDAERYSLLNSTSVGLTASRVLDSLVWGHAYKVTMGFRDSSGTYMLSQPSGYTVLMRNGTTVNNPPANAWMLSGTATLTSVTWQGSNVRPRTAPTIVINAASTYYYNVRVYCLAFNSTSFRDSSGSALHSSPTSFKLVFPNGTASAPLSLGSYLIQNGSVTWPSIIWQGTNVAPSTSFKAESGSPAVNCRIYPVDFTQSFRDNRGNPLYSLPQSFRLTFPNGTVSPPLSPGTYLIQNGSTNWSSIIWQGTDVTASASFSAEKGDPVVNCRVYSLQVSPTFEDNFGKTISAPSPWTLTFPNETTTTRSSSPSYSQVQYGNYTMNSVYWEKGAAESQARPTLTLEENKLWTPSITYILPTTLALSANSQTSLAGFNVMLNGTLRCSNRGVAGAKIQLYYSDTEGRTWSEIASAKTLSDGRYSATWMPSTMGVYTVRAEYNGSEAFPKSEALRTLSVISFGGKYVFSVQSNSTVSELTFNLPKREFSFITRGQTGTVGFVDVSIAKSLVADTTGLKVYLDNTSVSYTTTSTSDAWIIRVAYAYSSPMMGLRLVIPDPSAAAFTGTPLQIVMLATGVVAIIAVSFILIRNMRVPLHRLKPPPAHLP